MIEEWTSHAQLRRERYVFFTACLIVAIAIVAVLLSGCGTVTPRVVAGSVASFDGNQQNSGLIGFTPDGFGIITPHARDRYNALVASYAERFKPPLQVDAGITATTSNAFLIDAEHLTDFAIMNHWRKQTISPTK